ncbi:hypothetical protein PT974_02106 [Cladobotryum mycophilum]|uniref:MACPF-like domain-containing protein n=1 Tax=Cladobotryum mycophilum TaxID=491253 RepID=A0ABR0SYC2_9HYPO
MSDDTKLDIVKLGDINIDDIKPEDTKPEDTKPEDTKPEDTKPDYTKLDIVKLGGINIDNIRPEDTKPDDTKFDDIKPGYITVLAPPTLVSDDVSIHVILTDGTGRREACFSSVSKMFLDQEKLLALRGILAATGGTEIALLGFCSKTGASVPDSYPIKEYLSTCLDTPLSASANVVEFYMKKEGLTSSSQAGTSRFSQAMDAQKLTYIKQNMDDNAFKILTGTAAKYVAELEEQEWSIISENNALCYGINVVRRKVGGKVVAEGIERARYPAFRLKKRTILSDRLTSTSVKDVELDLRIPDFLMDDQSYVSVYETQSELQSSLATSSFSQTDVSAAVSGRIFGCTMGASASYGKSSSDSSSKASITNKKEVTIAYNFPRVTILLDEESLELTKECQIALGKVKDAASLTKFLEGYGKTTRVQLGGRLFATEEYEASSDTSMKALAKSMKASAAASFSGWGFSASASASHASGSGQVQSEAEARSSSALTWQANGGDTLLCHDPTAWCASVAYHWNWRITKQDKVVHFVNLVSNFTGYESLPAQMSRWDDERKAAMGPPPLQFLLHQDGVADGRYLTICSKTDMNTAVAVNAYNKQWPNDAIKVTQKHYDHGCVMLGPEKRKRNLAELFLELENIHGEKVTVAHYETTYRLKNAETSLYVTYMNHIEPPIVCSAVSKGCFVRFRSKSKNGSIAHNDEVVMELFKDRRDGPDSGPVKFIGNDAENSYIGINKTYGSDATNYSTRHYMEYWTEYPLEQPQKERQEKRFALRFKIKQAQPVIEIPTFLVLGGA